MQPNREKVKLGWFLILKLKYVYNTVSSSRTFEKPILLLGELYVQV